MEQHLEDALASALRIDKHRILAANGLGHRKLQIALANQWAATIVVEHISSLREVDLELMQSGVKVVDTNYLVSVAYKRPKSEWPKALVFISGDELDQRALEMIINAEKVSFFSETSRLKSIYFQSMNAEWNLNNSPEEQAPAAYLKGREITAADVLQEMANTFRERNAVYGSNYRMVAKLMAVLFSEGVPPDLVVQDQFHLFELMLVKISRYAISGLTHIDSVHDLAVYGAMCEAINREKK